MRHSSKTRRPRRPRQRIAPRASEPPPKRYDLPVVDPPEDLFIQLVSLLHKPDDSEEFERLIEVIGKPIRQYDIRSHRFCGLNLTYDIAHEGFNHVTFHFDTAGVRSGGINPYRGNLPCGIMWTDSCLIAEQKLGVKPERAGWVPGCDCSVDPKSRASNYWQHYGVPPFHFTLIFESEEGGLGLVGMVPLDYYSALRAANNNGT
jgi:hypothetical protein